MFFVVQALQQSQHTQLRVATIIALPTLVESILFKWKILPAAIGSKLVALASALFDHFNRYEQQLASNSDHSPISGLVQKRLWWERVGIEG